MAILAFQRPDKVIMVNSDDRNGVFEFRPLEPGYGITIGNSLRRILLSSLEGFAITSVRISGADHEFSTIKGVVEDVTEIILNLKQVRFKQQIHGTETEKVTVTVSGKNQLTAGDISKFTTAFQVLNPDLVLCNMEPSVRITMDIQINKGRGYVPSEENKTNSAPVGTIFVDSIYTPIRKDGKFVGLNHESILYDPEALAEPVRIVRNLHKINDYGDKNEEPYPFIECVPTIFSVKGVNQPVHPGDTFQYEYPDMYGRPWDKIWREYFEQGMSGKADEDVEALFDFSKK